MLVNEEKKEERKFTEKQLCIDCCMMYVID